MAEETKTPQELEKEKREADLQRRKDAAGQDHFVLKGKVYKPLLPAVNIPGVGIRTGLEICTDSKAQEYLVKEGCVGSVIEEVL